MVEKGSDIVGVIAIGWGDVGDLRKLSPKNISHLAAHIEKKKKKRMDSRP